MTGYIASRSRLVIEVQNPDPRPGPGKGTVVGLVDVYFCPAFHGYATSYGDFSQPWPPTHALFPSIEGRGLLRRLPHTSRILRVLDGSKEG
jgi:hypothetical protein